MFTPQDLSHFAARGINLTTVEKQVVLFCKGVDPVILVRPAVKGDGIEAFDKDGVSEYVKVFDAYSSAFSKIKFIPASGAASRMFRDLFTALNELLSDPYKEKEIVSSDDTLSDFFSDIEKYAFFSDLDNVIREKAYDVRELLKEGKYSEVLYYLLEEEGLNYGSKPKGALKFHKYNDFSRTPVEEHFFEAKEYLVNKDSSLRMHLTISKEHMQLFGNITEHLVKEGKEKNIILEVDYSFQESFTDSIAVDLKNTPFRDENGTIFFRPGGHGALLQNLGKLDEDLIFIGNIDNIAPDRVKPVRIYYKKFLGGYLIEKINTIRRILSVFEKGDDTTARDEAIAFVKENISSPLAKNLSGKSNEEFIHSIFDILNRPIRVCGMVKNTGEPGGGPFWIRNRDGIVSKQIIESSQIDMGDEQQKSIFNSSTHFNPVDIVCCIKDYKGNKFHLPDFRDDEMAFISTKSAGGREHKALELPGLWNGSMAGWITFFAEVPIETFSPVKTIFDLMRPEHQVG